MFRLSRTITLLAICALAAWVIAPAALAQDKAPGEETYILDVPEAGNGEASGQGSQGGSNEGAGVPAAAADGADEGGLPILLIILAGTALAGATIAIMRRQKT